MLELHLPPLQLDFAKSSKKQDISIIQYAVTHYAGSPNQFSCTLPIISPQLAQDMMSLTFIVPLMDDIKIKLQPFMVINGTKSIMQTTWK